MEENKTLENGTPVRIVNEHSTYHGSKGEVIGEVQNDYSDTEKNMFKVDFEEDDEKEGTGEFFEDELEIRMNE